MHTAGPILAWWAGKKLSDINGGNCRAYVTWRPIWGPKLRYRQTELSRCTPVSPLSTYACLSLRQHWAGAPSFKVRANTYLTSVQAVGARVGRRHTQAGNRGSHLSGPRASSPGGAGARPDLPISGHFDNSCAPCGQVHPRGSFALRVRAPLFLPAMNALCFIFAHLTIYFGSG